GDETRRAGARSRHDRIGAGAFERRDQPGRRRTRIVAAGAVSPVGKTRHPGLILPPKAYSSRMRLFSLEGKLALLLAGLSAGGVAFVVLLSMWWHSPWLVAVVSLLVLVPLTVWVARLIAAPLAAILRVVSGSVTSFRDGDFSVSLNATRRDELGDLLRAHNE